MTSATSEQIHEAVTLRLHLPRVQRAALLVGVGGLVLCGAGALWSREQFYQSYLFAYLFWLGPALGACALVMLSHVAGGRWSVITRRLFESGALTLPLLGLLFVPFLFGIPVLYAWARPEEIATSDLLQKKLLYLNEPFFIGRAVLYFVIWSGLALLLSRWSRAHDATARPGLVARMQGLSGAGLILYALTLTFAVTDWGMSLDYHWFSTVYGFRFAAGQGLTTFAFVNVRGVALAGVATVLILVAVFVVLARRGRRGPPLLDQRPTAESEEGHASRIP